MAEQLFILKKEQFHQKQDLLPDKIPLINNQNNNNENLLSNKNSLIDRIEIKNENFLDPKRKHLSKSVYPSLKKFLLLILFAIFIYVSWKKQDIFISRLLTSNSRIQRQRNYLIKIDSNDNHFHSTISVNDDKFNDENQQEIQNENLINSEIFHQEKNHRNSQRKKEKLVLKTRRNKMNFGQDSTRKNQNENTRPISMDETNLFSAHENQSKKTKKYSQNKDKDKDQMKKEKKTKKEKKKISLKNNSPSIEHSIEKNILSQLDKLIEKKNDKTKFESILMKETDLKKNVIQEIVQKRNYHLLTLDQFLSVLNRYQSTILIISK